MKAMIKDTQKTGKIGEGKPTEGEKHLEDLPKIQENRKGTNKIDLKNLKENLKKRTKKHIEKNDKTQNRIQTKPL